MPKTGFDRYFEKRMKDPVFATEYVRARTEIGEMDRLMRTLDKAREQQEMSKADLAREAEMTPEAIRRLFTSHSANPTLFTVVRLAMALGYRMELIPERRTRRASARAKKKRKAEL